MNDLADGDWARLAERFEWEMHRRGHKQATLESELAPNGPKVRSIRAAMRKRNPTRHSDVPPTHRRLAAYFGWAPGSIEAVLAGGEPTYVEPAEKDPPARPMARAVKDEWRRRVEESDMSKAAKRETFDLIDSIPDAD